MAPTLEHRFAPALNSIFSICKLAPFAIESLQPKMNFTRVIFCLVRYFNFRIFIHTNQVLFDELESFLFCDPNL